MRNLKAILIKLLRMIKEEEPYGKRNYSVYILSRGEQLFIAVGLVLFFTVAGVLFYDFPWFGPLGLILYVPVKRRYKGRMAEKEKMKLRNQFRDVLYSFSTSFSLGHHMEEAMREALSNLFNIYGGETLMSYELESMIRGAGETGEDEVSLWRDFAGRSDIEDIRDFAGVYESSRETGGNLPEAVNRASSVITDKIEIENEIRSMVSQKKTEGRIIGIMPVMVILFLRLTSPGYVAVMYETLIGRIIMTAGILGNIVAVAMAEKITSIEV